MQQSRCTHREARAQPASAGRRGACAARRGGACGGRGWLPAEQRSGRLGCLYCDAVAADTARVALRPRRCQRQRCSRAAQIASFRVVPDEGSHLPLLALVHQQQQLLLRVPEQAVQAHRFRLCLSAAESVTDGAEHECTRCGAHLLEAFQKVKVGHQVGARGFDLVPLQLQASPGAVPSRQACVRACAPGLARRSRARTHARTVARTHAHTRSRARTHGRLRARTHGRLRAHTHARSRAHTRTSHSTSWSCTLSGSTLCGLLARMRACACSTRKEAIWAADTPHSRARDTLARVMRATVRLARRYCGEAARSAGRSGLQQQRSGGGWRRHSHLDVSEEGEQAHVQRGGGVGEQVEVCLHHHLQRLRRR